VAADHQAAVPMAPASTAAQAAGGLIRGLTKQVGNELESSSLVGEEHLVGLRSIRRSTSRAAEAKDPAADEVRRQLFAATRNSALTPTRPGSSSG